MTDTAKYSLLSRPDNAGNIQPGYRSMRFDPRIWKIWDSLGAEALSQLEQLLPGGNVNPGNFALFCLNPVLLQNGYPNCKLETAFLEECMNDYQLFLQGDDEPEDFLQAARIALVLLEKRRISEHWDVVLSEISSKFRGKDQNAFVNKWRTSLGILENLTGELEDLYASLGEKNGEALLKSLIIPVLMLLGQPDVMRQNLAYVALQGMNIQDQVFSLRRLMELGETKLAVLLAEKLVQGFEGVDVSSKPVEAYWDRPFETHNAIPFNQSLAMLAHIAGNEAFEEKLLAKSEEMLNAAKAGIEQQKENLARNRVLHTQPANHIDVTGDSQLSLLEGDTSEQDGLQAAHQAKNFDPNNRSMTTLNSLMAAYQKSPEGFVNEVFEKRPKFDPSWNASSVAEDLFELGALEPAERIANRLLKENPADFDALRVAAKIKKASGKLDEAIDLLEEQVFCGLPTLEEMRELITYDLQLGRNEAAYAASQVLLKNRDAASNDRIRHAEVAAKIGKLADARRILEEELSQSPEDVDALCAMGKVYLLEGQAQKAKEILGKAADLATASPAPWVLLSDIHTSIGEQAAAVEALKKGLIALPGNREVRLALAEKLMGQGLAADALPLLQEMHNESANAQSDLMLLKAMKQLKHHDLDEFITSAYEWHPDEPQIAFEYADLMLRIGDHQKAGKILGPFISNVKGDSNWALVYADAVAGLDPRFTKNIKQVQESDLDEMLNMLALSSKAGQSANSRSECIKAELLLQKGLLDQAYSLLSNIRESGGDLSETWWNRVQTWFAWASAALGKLDIALATIRDVVSDDPSLLGAQQVLAEIQAFSEDTQEAVNQAQYVLEMAPDLSENLLWVGEFLSNQGETEKAIQVLSDGAKLAPEDLRFDLAMAQLHAKLGDDGEKARLVELLKQKLDGVSDPKLLFDVSTAFDNDTDLELIGTALRNTYESEHTLQNALTLAGFELRAQNFGKALEVLNSAEKDFPDDRLLKCCKADLLARTGQYDAAVSALKEIGNEKLALTNVPANGFIPKAWQLLMQSGDPVRELSAQFAFASGDPEKSLELSSEVLRANPGNFYARLVAVESARALATHQMVDELLATEISAFSGDWAPYLAAEKLETLLDKTEIDACWEEYNRLEEHTKQTPVIQLIESNLLFVEGNVAEAENLYAKVIGSLSGDEIDLQKAEDMISRRLMIKTAAKTWRWKDALKWADDGAKFLPWNQLLIGLFLSILIDALEKIDLSRLLKLEAHSPTESSVISNANENLQWIKQHLKADETQQYWLKRAELALSPDQHHIREFAVNKPSAEDAAVLMRALVLTGQGETAQKISKRFAEDAGVMLQTAQLAWENDPEAAFAEVEKLVTINSNDPIALAMRGMLSARLGKLEMAVADMESALQLWPNEFSWHQLASDFWASLGNDQKSIRHLEMVKEANPADVETGIKLAKGYFSKKDYAASIELLGQIAQSDPNRFEAWEALTDAQLAAGLVNEALDSAEKASQINPFSIKPYLIRAQIDLDNGLVEKAYEQIKQADEQVKENGDVKVFLARVLHAKGEKAAALAELENATHCENLSPRTILDVVNLIREINGTASARNLIEYFTRKMPENTELLSLLAQSQLENGDAHAAEVTARRVLKLKPDSTAMLQFLGKQQLEKGQLDQAIHSFSQVVNLAPENVEAYFSLSSAFSEQRETAKAVEMLKKVIEIDPALVSAYTQLAEIYKDAKNYKLAEEMLKQAVELEPKNVAIKRQLGALLALNLVHQSQEVSSQL
jgi:tetratricopeptide (TPR) repeat protein